MVLILALGAGQPTAAQVDLKKLGQSTMNFLKVSISPRAAAMGNAYTAVDGGAESAFYNSANLADVRSGYDVFLTHTRWIANIDYTGAAVARSFGNIGTFGISALMVDYGEVQGAQLLSQSDPQGYRKTGILSAGAYAFGITYARKISPQFSMGGQIQYASQTLGRSEVESGMVTNEEANLIGNFGVKFYPGFRSFRFAMSIRNFSTKATYEEVDTQLPLIFQVGAGIDVLDLIVPDHSEGTSFLISSEFIHPNNYTERVNVGGEYTTLDGIISMRAGYQFNRDLQGVSGGFGISPTISGTQVNINYSYTDIAFFSGVNRFSLGTTF